MFVQGCTMRACEISAEVGGTRMASVILLNPVLSLQVQYLLQQ